MADIEYYLDKGRARCQKCGEFEPVECVENSLCWNEYRELARKQDRYVSNSSPLFAISLTVGACVIAFLVMAMMAKGMGYLPDPTGMSPFTFFGILFTGSTVGIVIMMTVIEYSRKRVRHNFDSTNQRYVELTQKVMEIQTNTG